jgi:LacI family transcriptional regulator
MVYLFPCISQEKNIHLLHPICSLKNISILGGNDIMTNQPHKIVITAPYFGSLFQIAILEHFKKFIKPENMSMRSLTSEGDKQTEILKKLLVENKPTVLIAISMFPVPEIISMYQKSGVPIILVDEEARGASTIATDNYKGGQIAAEHLISKGRKKIGIVSGRVQSTANFVGQYNARLRFDGFKAALKQNGLSIPAGCTFEVANYSREDGVSVMPKFIDAGVDGIFCAAADNCALGLLAVARERGKRIPEDISIVSFDDLPVAATSTPGLTTIKQPMKDIVEAAYVMATMQREEILKTPKKLLFKPELIIRKSA